MSGVRDLAYCQGCRWNGDIYCWHPVHDVNDDLVVSRRDGGRILEKGNFRPVWCPGYEKKDKKF